MYEQCHCRCREWYSCTCMVASRSLATCSSRSRARMPPDSKKLVGVLTLLLVPDDVPRFGVRHPVDTIGMYEIRCDH